MNCNVTEDQTSLVLAQLPERSNLKQGVRALQRITDAPTIYAIVSYMACLAVSAEKLSMKFGRLVRPNFMGMCIGESQKSRKSTTIEAMRDIAKLAFPQLIGIEPGSAEGLIDGICKKQTQIIFFPEMGDLFEHTRDSSYASRIKTTLIKAADCSPIERQLANGKKSQAENPYISVAGGVAPPFFEENMRQYDFDCGYVGRYYVAVSERTREYDVPPGIDDSQAQGLATALRSLHESPRGIGLGFDPQAADLLSRWNKALADVIPFAPKTVAKCIAGACRQTIKIAMLLSHDYGQASTGKDWMITLEELIPAIMLTEFHIQSLIGLSEIICFDKDMQNRKRVLESIGTNEPTPLSEIIRRSKLLKNRVAPVIDSLVSEKEIVGCTMIGRDGADAFRRLPTTPEIDRVFALLRERGF